MATAELTQGVFSKAFEKFTVFEANQALKDSDCFSCNNGPGLRQAMDSIVIFQPNQRVWCPFQSFDRERCQVPLRIHGILPLSLQDDERGDYFLTVNVVADENFSPKGYVVNNGATRLKDGDCFLGVGSFYNRHWYFRRIQAS